MSFSQIVHGYWTQLVRGTNSSALCDGKTCEGTLIPLNHTFVVPGGRFREQCKRFSFHLLLSIHLTSNSSDYWDSFWILEGLIQSQLLDIAKDTLENFMDEVEPMGSSPTGAAYIVLCFRSCVS